MSNNAKSDKTEKREVFKSVFGKAVCVLLAILMWSYVSYDTKSSSDKTFKNIPVNIIGLDTLENRNMTILNNDILLSVKISGARNILSRVTQSDIKATFDVSNVTSAGKVSPDIKISGISDSLIIEDVRVTSGNIISDSLMKKYLNVGIDIIGTMNENVVEGDKQVVPAQIMVKGPATLIESINAWTEAIDISNIEKSENIYTTGIVLKDADGNIVENSSITLSDYSATVSIGCLGRKEVEVNPPVIVGSLAGYNITTEAIEPKTVFITGKVEDIAKISSVELEEVDAYYITVPRKMNVNLIIPEGIECDTKFVSVSFKVEKTENESEENTENI